MKENKEHILQTKLLEVVENSINNIIDEDLTQENLKILGELVDIHKDINNEKYWKIKECEIMRYSNYSNYGNYGNYNGNYGREQYNDNYGRRGYDRKYRGHDKIDEMYGEYGRYEEGREQYNRGNYGAKEDTLKSLEYMLKSMVEFVNMLKQDATSQEEMQLIQQYTRQINEM